MTTKILYLLLPLLSIIGKPLLSQSSNGSIKIMIVPSNALILLDGDTVSNGDHTVSLGKHYPQ
ncbi:MAG: hypothetical protein ACI85Q_000896 [Salibacteraceae bacterium]|jgi:hypothetical protein